MLHSISLHKVRIGDFIITPEGTIWKVDSQKSIDNLSEVVFYYATLGQECPILIFREFYQANLWNHRN